MTTTHRACQSPRLVSRAMTSHPTPSRPDATRASYDTVAVDYNELLKAELEHKPL